jgi:heme oxygenase
MSSFDAELSVPVCGQAGKDYSRFLRKVVDESLPRFMCHYYNHYFAHSAGGRMIGKKMGDMLFGGKVLSFYQWEEDVGVCLERTREKIDAMVEEWSDVQKRECLEETLSTFEYGGAIMAYLREPATR